MVNQNDKNHNHNRFEANQNKLDTEFRQNLFRDNWRAFNRQGIIWRAIGNLMLNGINLYWITLSCADKKAHWIDKQSVIKQNWLKLYRKWIYRYPSWDYALIASSGENGDNPHYHILSTAPLPDTFKSQELDIEQTPVEDTATDRKRLARYCELNMKQVNQFSSQDYRASKNFPLWSNPAIFHLYKELASPVYVYVHNSTKYDNFVPDTPSFKQCRFCKELLPETSNYFIKNRHGFRNECRHCNALYQKPIRANRKHSYAGVIDAEQFVLYCLERRVKGLYRDDYMPDRLVSIDDLEVDHMIALSIGGENTNRNTCITSSENNRLKSDMSFEAWIRLLYSQGVVNEWTMFVDCSDTLQQISMFEALA